MKFSISLKLLQRDLAIVAKVIQKKNMLAILDCVRVSKADNKFFLTGASSDNQLSIAFDLRQTDGGDFTPFCFSPTQLLMFLATLPEQPIELSVDEKANFFTTLTYEGGDFAFPSCSADGFPTKQRISSPKTMFAVPTATLLPRIKAAHLCTKQDDLRKVMSTVVLDASNEGVTIVAADSRKMYKYDYSPGAPFISAGEPSLVMLHRDLVPVVDAAFAKAESVTVSTDGQSIEISSGDNVLIAAAVEGKYPNYALVFPKESPYHITINAASLAAAVKRVSLAASTATNLLCLEKVNGVLQLQAEDIDYARKAKNILTVEDCTLPDNMCMGFNSESLLLLLGNITSPNVRLELTAPSRPMLIREDAPSSPLAEICMPMLVGDAQ